MIGGENEVPMLHLEKEAGDLPAGASGCPVILEKDGKHHLVGLHFSGDEDDEDGEAEALRWENGMATYIQKGVGIIIDVGTYLANKCQAAKLADDQYQLKQGLTDTAENAKKDLESTAEANRLTIYLTNGEIIKGQQ